MDDGKRLRVRNFLIEMVIYAILVSIYLYLVITYLADWLVALYNDHLTAYAVLALVFIVAQSVLLDSLTSFIMDRLRLRKLQ